MAYTAYRPSYAYERLYYPAGEASTKCFLVNDHSVMKVDYRFDLNKGVNANLARYRGHGASDVIYGREPDGQVYRLSNLRRPDVIYPLNRRVSRLQLVHIQTTPISIKSIFPEFDTEFEDAHVNSDAAIPALVPTNSANAKLRIGIASSGRFHLLDLARELDALGSEVSFYSYVPRERAKTFGLPGRCHVALLPSFFH